MDSVVVQLISLIKNRPPIYKMKSKTAKSRDILDRLWKEVAAEMQYPETDCRRKWNILRNCYARTLRHQRNLKTAKKPWYLQTELSFLKRYIKPHKAKEDDSEDTDLLDVTDASKQCCSIDIESSCSPPPVEALSPIQFVPIDEPLMDIYKTEGDQHEYLNYDYVHKISDEESNCSKISIKSSPTPLEEPAGELHKTQTTDEQTKTSNQLFLTSLLPDLNSLSERKQRIFKRKTIELLELLFEEDQYDAKTSAHYEAQMPDLDAVSTLTSAQVTAHHYDQPIIFTVTHKDELTT